MPEHFKTACLTLHPNLNITFPGDDSELKFEECQQNLRKVSPHLQLPSAVSSCHHSKVDSPDSVSAGVPNAWEVRSRHCDHYESSDYRPIGNGKDCHRQRIGATHNVAGASQQTASAVRSKSAEVTFEAVFDSFDTVVTFHRLKQCLDVNV